MNDKTTSPRRSDLLPRSLRVAYDSYVKETAIVDASRRWTYGDLRDFVNRVQMRPAGQRFEPGDSVAVLSRNTGLLMASFCAAIGCGAVWVPMSPRWSVEQNADYLRGIAGDWLLYDRHYAEVVPQLVAACPSTTPISIDSLLEVPGGFSAASVVPAGIQSPTYSPGPNDLFALIQTGGTTGSPKTVKLTHGNAAATADVVRDYFCPESSPRCLWVLPLAHAAVLGVGAMFSRGATQFVSDYTGPNQLLRDIEQYGITHIVLVPAMLLAVLRCPALHTCDWSSLVRITVGAGRMPAEELKQASEIFGGRLSYTYGQTEALYITHFSGSEIRRAISSSPDRLRSCGRAADPMLVSVLDDEGNELSAGEVGEIVVQGAVVTPGYLDDDPQSGTSRNGGWRRTGDVGYMDNEGFVFLLDRVHDMIKTYSYKVYPSEVEDAIAAMPGVLEGAVFGLPDELAGEIVAACAVVSDPAVTAEVIARRCRQVLGRVKSPVRVKILDSLPKTATGKVDKVALRTSLAQDRL